MKFTITLLAFFGTLAVGQSKPMAMDTEYYETIHYVFDYGVSDKEYSLPVVNLENTELNQFCKNVGNADGIPRALYIIENYGDDPRDLYFTCLIADDNTDEPTTSTENIPTETTESAKSEQNKPIDIGSTFFYVFNYGGDHETKVVAPVDDMSELSSFCENEDLWDGEKRRVKMIERDDDTRNVYFTCVNGNDNTDVPTAVPTTEPTTSTDYEPTASTNYEPTTSTDYEPTASTNYEPTTSTNYEPETMNIDSGNSDQNKKMVIVDDEPVQKFYYVFNYGDKYKETPVPAPVIRRSDLPAFCNNDFLWDGEQRNLKIIERNDDPGNVYFFCESPEKNTDTSTTTTAPEKTDEPTTNNENSDLENAETTVAPYKYIGEGYEYHPSIDAWMKVHTMPEDWHDARLRCLREGSTLASPIDANMLEAMKGLLGDKVPVAFTGISADYAPGFFYSVEGVSLDDIPASLVPGGRDLTQDSEGCIGMYPDGSLTNLRCYTPRPFICYVKDSDVPEIQSPYYVYESRTGKCYKFHTFGRSWSSAFMTCATEGGHLAILNSDVEAKAVVDLVNKYPESAVRSNYPGITLLGFRDWSEHRTWMTIHGQTLQKAGYARWGPNEPSDPRDEFCGSMFRNGELNDTLCKSPMPFVCEKKPAVPPKGTNSNSDDIASTNNAV